MTTTSTAYDITAESASRFVQTEKFKTTTARQALAIR
jgi:hypothetical protein